MHINNNEIFVKHKFYLQPKNRAGPRVQNSDLNYTHVETQVKNDNNNDQKQTIRSQTAKPVSHTCMYLQLILFQLYIYIYNWKWNSLRTNPHTLTRIYI